MQKMFAVFFLALLAITLSSCSTIRVGNKPLDYRDNLALPAGTVIKNVPFYVNGKDEPPTTLDFCTDSEGAFVSLEGLKAVQK
jgi:hypothetical protein